MEKHRHVNMHNQTKINISTRDRLLRAWENTMELTRDFSTYSGIEHGRVAQAFDDFSKQQGAQAAVLEGLLKEYEH